MEICQRTEEIEKWESDSDTNLSFCPLSTRSGKRVNWRLEVELKPQHNSNRLRYSKVINDYALNDIIFTTTTSVIPLTIKHEQNGFK